MKIWILNHYAASMYIDGAGRHHAFAKYLIRKGHNVKIFCANTIHNSDRIIDIGEHLHAEDIGEDNVPYVFVKTRPYKGNGKDRIFNMTSYYKNVRAVLDEYQKNEGAPDVIIASSVHPLALVAGIKVAKKYKIPCICEVRDLWPETFLDFGYNAKNPIILLLYRLERWIYKSADSLIFTMKGGKKYIIEKKWDDVIDVGKINYLNNGVDLEIYEKNIKEHFLMDRDLESSAFKVIYTGSIRPANGVDNIIFCAERVKDDIVFLIYGDGSEKDALESYCNEKKIDNVKFKGKVDKKYIPYVLSKSDMLLLNYIQADVDRYGTSQNKLFEYLAAGKPIVSNVNMGYDIIKKYNCGISKAFADNEEYVESILRIKQLSENSYSELCKNAKTAAYDYDYKFLSDKLESMIYKLVNEKGNIRQ